MNTFGIKVYSKVSGQYFSTVPVFTFMARNLCLVINSIFTVYKYSLNTKSLQLALNISYLGVIKLLSHFYLGKYRRGIASDFNHV